MLTILRLVFKLKCKRWRCVIDDIGQYYMTFLTFINLSLITKMVVTLQIIGWLVGLFDI